MPLPQTTGIVGRDAETVRLAAMLDRTAGAPRVLALIGEPGVGKSTLLELAMQDARRRGYLVLSAAGVEAEQALPFVTLHELLAPIERELDSLEPGARAALSSALGWGGATRPDSHIIARAVTELLEHAADTRPVLAVVDDAHWADMPSQRVLASVSRRLEGGPVVLLIGARTGYAGELFTGSLPELDIVGVDDDAAELILSESAGDLSPSEKAAVQEQARGNPLALEELPLIVRAGHDLRSDAPEHLTVRLEAAFASRVRTMPAETRDALLVASVDDVAGVSEVVTATSRLRGAPVTVDALTPAVAAQLVTVSGERVEFRHPLLRSGLMQSESPARRMAAHGAIAASVSDVHRARWHRSLSIVGPDGATADALEQSADAALERGGIEIAITFLERAAQLSPSSALRGRRLLRAAEQSYEIGRSDLVERQLAAAERTNLDDLGTARLHWLREIFDDGIPGDAQRVRELCSSAQDAAHAGDVDLALDLLLGAALRCWWADSGTEAQALVCSVARSIAPDTGDPKYIATLAVAEPVRQCATVMALLDARGESTDAASEQGRAEDDRLLGMAAHAIGDEARANRYLQRAADLLRREGRVSLLAHVLSMSVIVRQELGDLRGAADAAEEGARLAEETGQPIWNSGTIVCEARSRALCGEADEALRLAGEVEGEARKRRLNDLLACVGVAQGIAWLTTDRIDDALQVLKALFDPASPMFHERERFDGIMFLAEAAARAGRVAEIEPVLADLERLATVNPSPLLHRQLTCARLVTADDEAAGPLFEAAEALDLSEWTWVAARIRLLEGRWRRRRGEVERARAALADAADALERIGARPWAESAEQQLALLSHRGTEDDEA